MLSEFVLMCVIHRCSDFFCVCEFQIKTVEVHNGLLEDQFDVTVRMSTYLVAFVICDFKSVTATTSSGVQVLLMIFQFMICFPAILLSHTQSSVCRCRSMLPLRSGHNPTMLWKLQSKC